MKHLVFYDGACGLCDSTVQFILNRDAHDLFVFAPLGGETAKKYLQLDPALDSVVLIENYKTDPKTYVQSQAIFRILKALGGVYTVPGLLSFLPPVLFNWGYRFVARNRHKWFEPVCLVRNNPKFLP